MSEDPFRGRPQEKQPTPAGAETVVFTADQKAAIHTDALINLGTNGADAQRRSFGLGRW
ncbi:MAG: hypothetical protein ACREHC_01210 [Candidatus Levyibacteriota bacterium]